MALDLPGASQAHVHCDQSGGGWFARMPLQGQAVSTLESRLNAEGWRKARQSHSPALSSDVTDFEKLGARGRLIGTIVEDEMPHARSVTVRLFSEERCE